MVPAQVQSSNSWISNLTNVKKRCAITLIRHHDMISSKKLSSKAGKGLVGKLGNDKIDNFQYPRPHRLTCSCCPTCSYPLHLSSCSRLLDWVHRVPIRVPILLPHRRSWRCDHLRTQNRKQIHPPKTLWLYWCFRAENSKALNRPLIFQTGNERTCIQPNPVKRDALSICNHECENARTEIIAAVDSCLWGKNKNGTATTK